MTGFPDPSERAAFFATARGKLISALAVVALVLGIVAEGVSIYRNIRETHTATEVSINSDARQDAEAKKAKAEQCSAQSKALIDTVPMNRLPEALEALQRECDPTYAAHATDCDKRFYAIIADLEKASAAEVENVLKPRMEAHRQECPITAEQRKTVMAFRDKMDEKSKKAQVAQEILETFKLKLESDKEHKAGHYDKALELAKQYAAASEAMDKKSNGKPGTLAAGALGNVSFAALFARDYKAALAAADRAISLEPGDLNPHTNRAHALMFLGRTAEAKTVYLAHRGEKMNGHDWNYFIADDFKQLRAAGISHPFMAEIERELGLQAAAVATPEPKATP